MRTSSGRAELILDGHEHMARYAGAKTVDLICFNFGYLPGGNHEIATRAETSVQAVEAGLRSPEVRRNDVFVHLQWWRHWI